MRLVLLTFFLFGYLTLPAQKNIKKAEKEIRQLVNDFNGDMGVYVLDLKSGKTIEINADTVYPTASIIKIPILTGIMHKIHSGEFGYHQKLTYTDSLFYSEGEDILASFKSGEEIEMAKVISLMLSYSDNTASLWLQGLSGGGAVINELMEGLGLHNTKVNSRTPGRRDIWRIYGWGQTTPREIAQLMKMIVDNKIINQQISQRMLRMLGREYWDEYALAEIPRDIFVAHKGGAVDATRNEVAYVNGSRRYIFAVFSKNNRDRSWNPDNEAWMVTQKISAILWKTFNPKNQWTPPAPLK